MNNKEKCNFETRRNGAWDVLTNHHYNAEDYEKLLDTRLREYKELMQSQKLSNFKYAKMLLLAGKLIEADRVSKKEIQDYVNTFYDFCVKKVAEIENDKDYRDKISSENPLVDFDNAINRLLGQAVDLYYLFGKYLDSDAREELLTKSKEPAEKFFNRLVDQKRFYEALGLVENYPSSLPFEKGKMIAGEAIYSLLREQPCRKKTALELADKYQVEDEDILKLLTTPDKK